MHGGAETMPARAEEPTKRDFLHITTGVAAVGLVGGLAWPLIDQMNPAGDTLALASVEVEYTKVTLGQQIVVKWQGKPLFIRHRTPKEIAEAVADDHADLRDPATDASRHKPGMAEWLIVIGVCTHLGCVPTFGQGEYGGWLCPCHGSVYDTAGRIRKGPAPKNLVLPDYSFEAGGKVKVG
ncbi:ubiquinol-cytochrome c reductase iron-sulfur subunit [Phenylobacterium sp.]|jgi:ubiquinol-cytochrome c reductase iron-sulfur subunit|uniref:ubiquinol-cytochrome c reductase iron-sulfur subunit n=1 Tax=Phenylobacterium sp. TaxID=1871053 RepID=UPI002E305281|nr:ubiquinol-cytochrome c reductase iron-sulfur subunit [Phenylobacterium sp.]HEX3366251.1 ubiquinol-cytochrome c reductase iron-sulfur subunit [Phenylobacterium sp.]